MKDKLRELVRKMKTFRGDVPQEAVAYWINELLAILDAKGDGGDVRSVSDADAHAALLVFRSSGWDGGKSQPEEAMRAAIEAFLKGGKGHE